MEQDEFKKICFEVEQNLGNKFWLIPRDRAMLFIGGCTVFLALTIGGTWFAAHNAVKSTGVTTTINEINRLKQEAVSDERTIKRALDEVGAFSTSGDGTTGFAKVGDLLICWGQMSLTKVNGNDLRPRTISCNFPANFVEVPRVSLGFRNEIAKDVVLNWSPFNVEVTPVGYSATLMPGLTQGGADNVTYGQAAGQVDYIAMGRWRK